MSYYSINPTSYHILPPPTIIYYLSYYRPWYARVQHPLRTSHPRLQPRFWVFILLIAPPFQKRVNRCMILCQKSLFNLSNYLPTGAKKQSYRGRNKNRFQNPSQVVLPLATCHSLSILVFMGDCSYLVKSLYLLLHKESICIKNAETVE
jgi:hypothetical protein